MASGLMVSESVGELVLGVGGCGWLVGSSIISELVGWWSVGWWRTCG